MATRRRVLGSLSLLLLGLGLSACVGGLDVVKGPFRGQIVDAETGQPIAGAVVLAVWETLAWTPLGHGGQEFYDTREAISDADGRFEIPRLPIAFGKLDVQQPGLYFFAPGYVLSPVNFLPGPIFALADPYQYEQQPYTVTPPDAQRFIAPTVVRMRPLKTKEEWCRSAFMLPPLRHSMADKMPLMLGAVQNEKRARGLCK